MRGTAAVSAIAAGAMVVAIGGTSFALASGGAGEDTSFRLIEVRTAVTALDLPPSGGSIGDEFVLAGRLRNAADTHTVGSSNDVCIALSASGTPLQCSGVITLEGGTLEIAGNAPGGPNFALGISGGTGAYDDAHGQLVAAPGPHGDELIKVDIDR
jgi:allene oxide cyclase